LDRDGTILNERGYLGDPKRMKFYPSAIRGLKSLQKLGFRLLIISNQSGVARGYFSLKQLGLVNRVFKQRLAAKGIRIDGIYFCPHLPTAGCGCRKPNPGMIRRAVRDFRVKPKQSYMIGDQERDVELAKRVGATGILVLTGARKSSIKGQIQTTANKVAKDLEAASRWIYNRESTHG
jgi:histidinol-phosphate phosphatase family protein